MATLRDLSAARRGAHQLLERQIRSCLGGEAGTDFPEAAAAFRSRPEKLERLLAMVDDVYAENDLYLDRTLAALDRASDEARDLHREEAAKAQHLEEALAEKERALEELNRAKSILVGQEKLAAIGTLASGIAHEINTPIQYVSDNLFFLKNAFESLLGHLEGAQEVPLDKEFLRAEVPGALRQAAEGLERVAAIVRSMKEFSHPGGGVRTPCDLNRSLENAVTVSRNAWKNVAELERDLDPELPPVACVAGEINQVLLNLVVNAAHAIEDRRQKEPSAPAGRIRVSTHRDGGRIRLEVADNGCGIPDEIAHRVFDPFFTTKGVGRGTGQGLAISKAVADKHGGALTFGPAPGGGTVFSLELPLETKRS
jgi:signal transduction histidine kinase